MTLLFKDIVLSYGKKIFADLQKFKYYSLSAKSSLKIKRSKFFGVNNDMQNISFWKLFTERSFCKLKAYNINDMLSHT